MGIKIPKIRDLSEALEKWDKDVADVHLIHGVGRSPLEIFKSEEEKALQPLPKDRWEPTSWSQCIVRREWRIMVDCAYYSVPYQLIGETVEVCMTVFISDAFFISIKKSHFMKEQQKNGNINGKPNMLHLFKKLFCNVLVKVYLHLPVISEHLLIKWHIIFYLIHLWIN